VYQATLFLPTATAFLFPGTKQSMMQLSPTLLMLIAP
jgi:hypothetical protein